MKTKLTILSAVAVMAMAFAVRAADTKVAGDATCAKCNLKQADECQMAIKVKNTDGTSETLMVENNQISKDFHDKICKETRAVNGEGSVTEKDGKKTIALNKIYLSK